MSLNLFEVELEKNKKIFKNRNVLTHHYIPDVLPFREKQIKEITETIIPILRGEKPNNIFIYGKTGTGKTCTTKYVLNKLEEYCKKNNLNVITIYLNCTVVNTKYQILLKILSSIKNINGFFFGIPTTFLYDTIKSELLKDIHVILVLDEIDRVKDINDLLYILTRINDELGYGKLTIIGITNNVSFKSSLDQRALSSLLGKEIVFPPYDAEQLYVILKERCIKGFVEGVIDDAAIRYISAISAQESGDARYALKLLLSAGDLAVKKELNKIDIKLVKEAKEKAEEEIVLELVGSLPQQHKLVLYAIALLTENKKKEKTLINTEETSCKLTSGEVYDMYKKLCLKYGKEPRTSRWFREYINELDLQGLITTRASGVGYRGQTTLIELSYPYDKIKKICERYI